MIDETKVMQYADGTLPTEEREEVKKAIEADPKLNKFIGWVKFLTTRLIASNIFERLFLNSKKVVNLFFSLSVNWFHLDEKSSTR